MEFQLQIKMNDNLFLRNPEQSELGKKIISKSIQLIDLHGFESFTFRKLAIEIGTTEASVYRYFENKHRLLVYHISWYWSWLDFRVNFHTMHLTDPWVKLKKVVLLFVIVNQEDLKSDFIDITSLHRIIIAEGTKTYLTKHVSEDNKARLFKPYKDLCAMIGQIILECNNGYKYPRSLSSTIIEMAHFQYFFRTNLPSLTDSTTESAQEFIVHFLEDIVFSSLKKK